MEINLIKDEKSLDAVLSINIKLADFEENAIKSLKAQKQKIQLPGFRQGKVPLGIAKKYLWEGIVKEELEKTLEGSIDSYLEENKIDIIKPVLPIVPDTQINLASDQEFEFKYDVGIVDDFELDPKKIIKPVVELNIKVEDKDVEKEIEMIQETYGNHTNPEVIEDEDTVTVYLEVSELDSEESKLEEGISKKLIKKFPDLNASFKKVILGKKKDDVFNVNMNSIFKSKKSLAEFLEIEKLEAEDASEQFQFKIISINKQEKAALDEELFNTATQGEAKTIEEFRNYVTERISTSFEQNSKAYLDDDIYKALLDKVKLELPLKFIDRLFEEEYREKKNEMSAEDLSHERKHFDEKIKWSLIMKRFVDSFEIEIKEEEIVQEAYSYVSGMYMQYGMYQAQEQMQEILKEFLSKPENVAYIKERVEVSKVFDKLRSDHEFEKKDVTIEEFRKLTEEKQKHQHD